jgi:UDP-N-acetylmuramoylalanine--D-glutamate ligase
VEDKKAVFREQETGAFAVFNRDDPWQSDFPNETAASPRFFSSTELPDGVAGAWLRDGGGFCRTAGKEGKEEWILPAILTLRGEHNRQNLLCAGLCLRLFGVEPAAIRTALAEFRGVEHRLEPLPAWRRIRFYNDSAATIPHAAAAAVHALEPPVVLITGGTDKNLDFTPLREVARVPARILLLEGTATEKIRSILERDGIPYGGPYPGLREAVEAAMESALSLTSSGRDVSVLLSPGCASFGMFLNEFDRGRKFKSIVAELTADRG